MLHGNTFVISAPSGAGKSSLIKALSGLDQNIKVSISHTTRGIRPGEINGVDYFFIKKSEFEMMLQKNEFLEYANVYDNYYGTSSENITKFLPQGYDVILEIDYKGAQQIKKIIPEAVFIYILPPHKKELERRLRSRGADDNEVIEKRLSLAYQEILYAKEFDYIIINDDFNVALQSLYSIILVQRLKSKNVLNNYNLE